MLQSVHVPADLETAFDALTSSKSSALLSGGTLLMPEVNTRATGIDTLVSTRALDLAGITVEDGRATVGATTTLDAFGRDKRLAVLKPVIESIASPGIRNMATVGGNLFAPQPYGDLAAALLALNAEAGVASASGERIADVGEIIRNGVRTDEIVTHLSFDLPDDGSWYYLKAMRRKLNSAAIATIAAHIPSDGEIRIALGGCGPRALRASSVEAALAGKALTVENVTAAAALAEKDTQPATDAYATDWYRARTLPVFIRRALCGA